MSSSEELLFRRTEKKHFTVKSINSETHTPPRILKENVASLK